MLYAVDRIVLQSQGPVNQLFSVNNLLISVWASAPTVEAYEIIAQTARDLGRQHPYGVAFANVVSTTTAAGKMSPEVRERINVLAHDETTGLRGTAVIILDASPFARAIRAIVSTVLLMTRSKLPTKLCSSVDQAALWLAGILPHDANAPPWNCGTIESTLKTVLLRAQKSTPREASANAYAP